ncbi:MAG: amidophosphoribosyltransferase [Candidatus Saccharimonadales bacterium]
MVFSFQQEEDCLVEKCAVFGAFNAGPEAARLAFYGLWALQHRGQESSGIVSSDNERLHRHAAPGLVANAYREEDLEQLPGTIAIGHNRYSTSGAAEGAHSQPVLRSEPQLALAHNGNFPITTAMEAHLKKHGVPCQKLNDSEMMTDVIHTFMQDGYDLEQAITRAYPLLEGVFSAVAMTADTLVAFRDTHGIRPLSIGTLGDGYVVASETCAFDTVGATFLRDVKPGELIIIDKNGLRAVQIVSGNLKLDIFEFVYFARPDSMLLGRSVNAVRQNLGKELAKEWKIDADLVVPVPDSAIPAALGYSRATGIPFEMAIIKNRYIHRTFIRPNAQMRQQDVRMKLNPIPDLIRGKRVVLIDDSIVRGTTTKKIAQLLYDAGAKEVHVLISSPPVVYPDFYGINISDQTELIASRMTPTEIGTHIGADSLGYLSYDGMIRATGMPASTFSTACFNGVYHVSTGTRIKNVKHAVHA